MPDASDLSPVTNRFCVSKETSIEVVKADGEDGRDWLGGAEVCSSLAEHRIAHVGYMEVVPPFEISRVDQSGTFMMACLSGVGKVLVDGRYQKIRAGQACLLPPFMANQLIGIESQEWSFCWVRYEEPRGLSPLCNANTPIISPFPVQSLYHAVAGLQALSRYGEGVSTGNARQWVELIHQQVLGFAQPYQEDDRLWKLWIIVEKNLSYPWTLEALSQQACMSKEHLRRLVKKQLGRSPIQHLTYLRMQKAAALLVQTQEKVETIAREVGYETGFSFSATFKRWSGIPPSEYREG